MHSRYYFTCIVSIYIFREIRFVKHKKELGNEDSNLD
jgi:hypothetical protein